MWILTHAFFAETFQPMNAAVTFQIGLNESARAIRGKVPGKVVAECGLRLTKLKVLMFFKKNLNFEDIVWYKKVTMKVKHTSDYCINVDRNGLFWAYNSDKSLCQWALTITFGPWEKETYRLLWKHILVYPFKLPQNQYVITFPWNLNHQTCTQNSFYFFVSAMVSQILPVLNFLSTVHAQEAKMRRLLQVAIWMFRTAGNFDQEKNTKWKV